MQKLKGFEAINKQRSQGVIGASWIRQIMAAYDSMGGSALEEFPYLEEWDKAEYVDRKWITPLVDKGYERSGFMYLAANARFANPAGLGKVYEEMMRAPTLRHGVAVLAFNANEFDRELSYAFSNFRSDELSIGLHWVISFNYKIGHKHHEQVSAVIHAAALIKYFTAFHGEAPLSKDVWVELDLPEHDVYLLNRAIDVPVSIGPANRVYVQAQYASRQSLHTNRWDEVLDDTTALTAKNWAGRVAMTVSCWDFTEGNKPTIEGVASQLHITPATLRNRLRPDYLLKDVMKEAEMKRVKNSLENGLSLKDAQLIYGYANLRDLKTCYKKYIGEDIEKARRRYVKNTGSFF